VKLNNIQLPLKREGEKDINHIDSRAKINLVSNGDRRFFPR
jgi:hypothetical protein